MKSNRPEDRNAAGADSPRTVAGPEALRQLFAACCEYAFEVELGVADPQLVDYMSEMLVRFVRSEKLAPFRKPDGTPINRIAEMLEEAESREGRPKRELQRHIGDVSLFWTGVYPESLPKIQSIDSPDFLLDVPSQGRRCYRLAAEYDDETSPVLLRIAEEYEVCQEGLSIAREAWRAA